MPVEIHICPSSLNAFSVSRIFVEPMNKAVEVFGVIRAIMDLDEQLQCSIPDQIHDVLALLFHAQPFLRLALSDRSFSLTTSDSDPGGTEPTSHYTAISVNISTPQVDTKPLRMFISMGLCSTIRVELENSSLGT